MRQLFLDRDSFAIGRAADNDAILDDPHVSRHHARIDRRDGVYYVIDLGSATGTHLNGEELEPKQPARLMMEDEGWLSDQERRALLRTARACRRELPARSSVPCVSVIGYGMKTLTRFQILRSPKGSWEEIGLLSEPAGDDTIPESAAIADGSDVHPVRQHHSSLFVDNDVKMRLKLELTRPGSRARSR